ncbi:hypothetical protein DEAC_c30410 [Desulfosporosinus acididurans]|uniref:4Fe4S-binding SPASM domain-containing protein n=1 Tax=Desulfosporosinus acididurans TaxID=476652 RepID=A0A0J1FNK8_9FIRM|nr:SPASM domain-containing protein [Desulfosporosinus acididurans]KLU65074.1 hypothetical protein DEAC_c30410 [Desulfosporosinus acididurans]
MKYCSRPFKQLYVFPNGDVRACGWTYVCIGNILNKSIEEVWNSSEAETIRDTIRDGSYSLCNNEVCPYLANNTLPDLSQEEFTEKTISQRLPSEFNAAYDYICNHSCPSCRHEVFKPNDDYIKNIKIISDKLVPVINQADSLSTNGNGDCFASPYVMDMLQRIRPQRNEFLLQLETNGVLCDEIHWEKISHLYKNDIVITVTPNSFERLAYKYLSGGHDNLDTLIKNLHFIKSLRQTGKIKRFEISIVVQDRNYRELPSFVHRCLEEFECDCVVIKPIFYWFALTKEEYWFKDILNPKHPYFNEYMEILKDPILMDERVYFWGAHHIHEEKEHPYYDYKIYFDAFSKLLSNPEPQKSLEKKLIEKGYKRISIYGVNDNAKLLFNLLKGTQISVVEFIDKYATVRDFCGLPVVKLDDFNADKIEAILVSNFVFLKNITRDLRFFGFKGKIIPFNE